MSKPRYKNAQFQKVWLLLLKLAEDKSSELYLPDGSPHRGASHRCAFWDGFSGRKIAHFIIPNSLGAVAYYAGKEFKRRSTFGRKKRNTVTSEEFLLGAIPVSGGTGSA